MNDPDSFGTRSPLDDVDAAVLNQIKQLYQILDPVPSELYDRVFFAFDLESAEAELATLCDEALAGSSVRATEQTHTMTFDSDAVTITVSVSRTGDGTFRLDGWLAPAGALRLELRTRDLRIQAMSDEAGRFVLDDVSPGEIQLAVHPTPGSGVELSRTVLTPPIVL